MMDLFLTKEGIIYLQKDIKESCAMRNDPFCPTYQHPYSLTYYHTQI